MELVDMVVSKTIASRRTGSNPVRFTSYFLCSLFNFQRHKSASNEADSRFYDYFVPRFMVLVTYIISLAI